MLSLPNEKLVNELLSIEKISFPQDTDDMFEVEVYRIKGNYDLSRVVSDKPSKGDFILTPNNLKNNKLDVRIKFKPKNKIIDNKSRRISLFALRPDLAEDDFFAFYIKYEYNGKEIYKQQIAGSGEFLMQNLPGNSKIMSYGFVLISTHFDDSIILPRLDIVITRTAQKYIGVWVARKNNL